MIHIFQVLLCTSILLEFQKEEYPFWKETWAFFPRNTMHFLGTVLELLDSISASDAKGYVVITEYSSLDTRVVMQIKDVNLLDTQWG